MLHLVFSINHYITDIPPFGSEKAGFSFI